MKIATFEMERMQSTWENQVRYNLSESGVHPLRLEELAPDSLGQVLLGYPQTNGTPELRERIAALYPGSRADQILVTNGAAEANFIGALRLVEPGDEVICVVPNYMQIAGVARSLGADVKLHWLRIADGRWGADLDALARLVNGRTRLIAFSNPNNPTGGVLTREEMDFLCETAGRVGAWLLADEIYQGAELDSKTTPSFWGRYDRLLVTAGLSKAYGLPGLRIGWVAGPPETIADLWRYKDYSTIGPGALSDFLARTALEPDRRASILERTRRILREQFPVVEAWVRDGDGLFTLVPPLAGAIAYVRYHRNVPSLDLFERLRDEKSVLVVAGHHFEMEGFLRIGFGGERSILEEGLGRISEVLAN